MNNCPDCAATISTKGRKGGTGQEGADYFRLCQQVLISSTKRKMYLSLSELTRTSDQGGEFHVREEHIIFSCFFNLPITDTSVKKRVLLSRQSVEFR